MGGLISYYSNMLRNKILFTICACLALAPTFKQYEMPEIFAIYVIGLTVLNLLYSNNDEYFSFTIIEKLVPLKGSQIVNIKYLFLFILLFIAGSITSLFMIIFDMMTIDFYTSLREMLLTNLVFLSIGCGLGTALILITSAGKRLKGYIFWSVPILQGIVAYHLITRLDDLMAVGLCVLIAIIVTIITYFIAIDFQNKKEVK